MTAAEIMVLLAAKHAKDVFVPECKDGPTQFGPHLRLDAWAMKRSWASPLCIGYEVKVARSDFVSDDKWHGYLGLCNEFYFVSPAGLIERRELPPEAGLLEVYATGSGLRCVKKAARRHDVVLPESLWRYIVMSRSKIVPSPFMRQEQPTREERIAEWMRIAGDAERIGRRVGDMIGAKHHAMEHENARLLRRVEKIEKLEQELEAKGVCLNSWQLTDDVLKACGDIRASLSDPLARLQRALEDVGKAME